MSPLRQDLGEFPLATSRGDNPGTWRATPPTLPDPGMASLGWQLSLAQLSAGGRRALVDKGRTAPARRPRDLASTDAGAASRHDSHVAKIRRALAQAPQDARELAAVAVVAPGQVRGLLKADIDGGRVRVRLDAQRRARYEWSPDFDTDLERQLRDAIKLLARHGYAVGRQLALAPTDRDSATPGDRSRESRA